MVVTLELGTVYEHSWIGFFELKARQCGHCSSERVAQHDDCEARMRVELFLHRRQGGLLDSFPPEREKLSEKRAE